MYTFEEKVEKDRSRFLKRLCAYIYIYSILLQCLTIYIQCHQLCKFRVAFPNRLCPNFLWKEIRGANKTFRQFFHTSFVIAKCYLQFVVVRNKTVWHPQTDLNTFVKGIMKLFSKCVQVIVFLLFLKLFLLWTVGLHFHVDLKKNLKPLNFV